MVITLNGPKYLSTSFLDAFCIWILYKDSMTSSLIVYDLPF
jgi:hypothetical protein